MNFNMFQQLCGVDGFNNIILTTTYWGLVRDHELGSRRESELKSDYWSDMVALGSQVARFQPPTYETAWDLIDRIDPTRVGLNPRGETWTDVPPSSELPGGRGVSGPGDKPKFQRTTSDGRVEKAEGSSLAEAAGMTVGAPRV